MALPVAPSGQPMRRLALSLVLALVLHGVALFFLRFPASSVLAGRPMALEVVLLPVPSSADSPDARPGAAIGGMVALPPRRAELQLPVADGESAALPVSEYPPAISAAQLLESARRILREEANKPEPGAPNRSGNPAENTVEAKLARALSTPSAGEKWLGDGLIKITTVFGTSYCLKAPPDRMRGGPVEPVSIPMTCP